MLNEEKKVKRIVVDSGKAGTKAIGRDTNGKIMKIHFETKMHETNETTTEAVDSYAIQVLGKNYMLGKIATESNFETDKTQGLHRNAIYTAIHQLVNDNDEVSLVVGCPLSVYTNKQNRERYESYLMEHQIVEITVNNVKKSFKIVSVSTLPESVGYLIKHGDKYHNEMVAIVDIGGLNANCAIYEDGDMQTGSDLTYLMGTNILIRGLKNALNKEFLSNLSDKQVKEAIRKNHIRQNPEESKKIIDDFLYKHIIALKNEMISSQWDIKNLDFVFVGGGSLLLKDEIQKVFGENVTFSDSGVWDNAEGFAIVAGV